MEVVPGAGCCADAHAEYLAYGKDVIATHRDTNPLVEKAGSA